MRTTLAAESPSPGEGSGIDYVDTSDKKLVVDSLGTIIGSRVLLGVCEAGERLEPLPMRQLLAPCLITLFIGQFLSPVLLSAVWAAVGGLQPALGVLGLAAAVMAVTTAVAIRSQHVPLTVTTS